MCILRIGISFAIVLCPYRPISYFLHMLESKCSFFTITSFRFHGLGSNGLRTAFSLCLLTTCGSHFVFCTNTVHDDGKNYDCQYIESPFSDLFRWNQLDVAIVFLSVLGIVLEELKSDLMPINPTIMRVMRVLRIARGKEKRQTTLDASLLLRSINVRNWMNISSSILVLKLLKMAKGIRALLDTVMQALPQVGNLGLLFFLLFFIFAALGVEMFGRLGKYYININ